MSSRWVTNLIIASFLAFSIYLGFGMILPLFPLYVGQLKGGGFAVGLLMAAFMFTRAFLTRPFGRLSDRLGRKKVIITGMFLYAILAVLFTLPTHWYGLLIVRVLQGTASAMVWPVGEAFVVDSSPKDKRSRALSVYILASNIGSVAGPLCGGLIIYMADVSMGLDLLHSFRIPFYFTSAVSLAAALFGLFFLKDVIPARNPSEADHQDEDAALRSISTKESSSLRFLYGYSFIEGLGALFITIVIVLFLANEFGMSATDSSILFGIATLLGLMALIPTGFLADRLGRKRFIVNGTLASNVFTTVLAFSSMLPFGAAIAVASFTLREMGRQIAMSPTKALVADIAPERVRGRIIGTMQAYSNFGAVIGSLSGGLIWDLTKDHTFPVLGFPLPGESIPSLAAVAAGAVSIVLVQRFVHERRSTTGTHTPGRPWPVSLLPAGLFRK